VDNLVRARDLDTGFDLHPNLIRLFLAASNYGLALPRVAVGLCGFLVKIDPTGGSGELRPARRIGGGRRKCFEPKNDRSRLRLGSRPPKPFRKTELLRAVRHALGAGKRA
jgi:hypothetical protein